MSGTQQFNEQIAATVGYNVLIADGAVTINWAPTNGAGSRIDYCWLYNNDGVDHYWVMELLSNGQHGTIGRVLVPNGSGVGGVKPVEAFAAIFASNPQGIALAAVDQLLMTLDAAVSTDGACGISMVGGIF